MSEYKFIGIPFCTFFSHPKFVSFEISESQGVKTASALENKLLKVV